MINKIIQIGNSIGIIFPQRVLEKLGIKVNKNGVDAKFMRMVDKFAEDHKDVLQELARK